MTASGDATASFVTAFGQNFGNVSGSSPTVSSGCREKSRSRLPDSRVARVSGSVIIHPEHNELHVAALQIEFGKQRWALSQTAGSPVVSWSGSTLSASGLVFDAGTGAPGRISIDGELGRTSAGGEVTIRARDVPLADLPPSIPFNRGLSWATERHGDDLGHRGRSRHQRRRCDHQRGGSRIRLPVSDRQGTVEWGRHHRRAPSGSGAGRLVHSDRIDSHRSIFKDGVVETGRRGGPLQRGRPGPAGGTDDESAKRHGHDSRST